RLDDAVMADAVLAVSTTSASTGRQRIRYRDLDVEELGTVYERVLDYEPATFTRDRDVRKATGTFYTPRQMTAHLVRETLSPLVHGRTAGQILSLRILDPAMGSGAFLVAACRYLAASVEDALIAEGQRHPADISPDDRAAVRRQVAQRCLYGVDLNPIAVQLARLSLWLATLASGKPLTFLDHHLVTGNSLVGATLTDIARQPGGGRRRGGRTAGPLFDDEAMHTTLTAAGAAREAMATRADDSAAIVRDKELTLAALQASGSSLGRCARLLDLWCSGWFVPKADRSTRGMFNELADVVLRSRGSLPVAATAPFIARAQQAAASHQFLHWPLAFPEVFNDGGGFDAVLGNPPWDMVRGDSGDGQSRESRRDAAAALTAFVRESGVYRVEAQAHLNRYALFTERALQLVRPGGRLGFVLPAGAVTDVGTAPLRRHLFDRAAVDVLTGLDNRAGIFPIHRSVRFVLLSATAGSPTQQIACRFGVTDLDDLDRGHSTGPALLLTRSLLARVSGQDDCGVPDVQSAADLRILESISATVPRLGDAEGWHVRFGRELNASDDRQWFVARAEYSNERPVLEGKHVAPFRVDEAAASVALAPAAHGRVRRRARLAYRDVAGAGNRLTLIAAIVPPHAVTTHTLFCLKTPLPLESQQALCALMNSFVANYLVRLRVSTHVTASLIARLRVPVVREGTRDFARLSDLARSLASGNGPAEQQEEYVELQALAARLYGLEREDLRHILSRFPLMPIELREAVLSRFNDSRCSRATEAPRHRGSYVRA
ncbi:MAG: N-6 DNA methylase, partial [Vicinamibacterales bacterium]